MFVNQLRNNTENCTTSKGEMTGCENPCNSITKKLPFHSFSREAVFFLAIALTAKNNAPKNPTRRCYPMT
jgi:hypothetical protein